MLRWDEINWKDVNVCCHKGLFGVVPFTYSVCELVNTFDEISLFLFLPSQLCLHGLIIFFESRIVFERVLQLCFDSLRIDLLMLGDFLECSEFGREIVMFSCLERECFPKSINICLQIGYLANLNIEPVGEFHLLLSLLLT